MVKTILKFLFAGAIVYWLIHSGKLDFSLISKSFSQGINAYLAILVLMFQAGISSLRWKILLETKTQEKLPPLKLIKLTWIGLFFSSVLPGAVTGDILKLVYAKDLNSKLTRTFLIMSALMDRILGLMGLLFILGVFSIFNYSSVVNKSPIMANLIHINFLLFIGVIVFFITLFLPQNIQHIILHKTHEVPILGNRIANTIEQVWLMGKNKSSILKCLGLSMFLQLINVFAFWMISHPFYEVELALPLIYTFVPLGLMAIAVPISPAGLGVGHAIFDKLFSFFGVHQGASLFNLYFICIVFVNLLGIIPYLMAGKKKSELDIKEFEDIESDLMSKETEQI